MPDLLTRVARKWVIKLPAPCICEETVEQAILAACREVLEEAEKVGKNACCHDYCGGRENCCVAAALRALLEGQG